MSDSDSFIDEVTEELKRDRMFRLWRRYGGFVIGAIFLLVAGAGAKAWRDHAQEEEARRVSGQLVAAAEMDDPAARAAAFLEIAEGEKAALVARFRAAEAFAEAGDVARAVEALDAIAADASLDRVYRDLAALKSAQQQFATRPPAETVAALEPLVAEDSPYRLLALETQAAALFAAGDSAGARENLDLILGDPMTTNELRQRAQQFAALLGPGES